MPRLIKSPRRWQRNVKSSHLAISAFTNIRQVVWRMKQIKDYKSIFDKMDFIEFLMINKSYHIVQVDSLGFIKAFRVNNIIHALLEHPHHIVEPVWLFSGLWVIHFNNWARIYVLAISFICRLYSFENLLWIYEWRHPKQENGF